MKESIGGGFIIKLALIFIVLYTSFMAIAINYAKAFRVKNQVINILEQRQFDGTDQGTLDYIRTYLLSVPYGNDITPNCGGGTVVQGVCITAMGENIESFSESTRYYVVETYIHWKIQIGTKKIEYFIPIRGETKTIYTR